MSAPVVEELDTLLDRWLREIYGNTDADPIPVLKLMAELIERETESYLKLPIDPFDDRHPSRAYPDCTLGALFKALFKNEDFMSELTGTYISASEDSNLLEISLRLLIDVLPGLDAAVIFLESDTLVPELLEMAEHASFPLHAYATAILASAMDVPTIAARHREQNFRLVPVLFNRLHQITYNSDESSAAGRSSDIIDPKDLVDVQPNPETKSNSKAKLASQKAQTNGGMKRKRQELEVNDDDSEPSNGYKRLPQDNLSPSPMHNEWSSSSWAEAYMSGSYSMHPLNTVMHQRFILQYLSTLGEYQEMLVHMFDYKAISYILRFIDSRQNQDVRLAFDALKFLASFLQHKKFALEFLDHGGLPQLLKVSKHGMASTGIGFCLYTISYNQDVMERICWMKRETVEKMVSYGLWLLECSHDSGRCHSAMFFSQCFQFPLLLGLFDRDNGLRKLLNVISMRGLLSDDPSINDLSDDEVFSRRHTAKQVTVSLKRYTRAHFILETRKHMRTSVFTIDLDCKPTSLSDENFLDAVEQHRIQSFHRFNWQALDKMIVEDGILYLLKLIAHFWNEGLLVIERAEIVKSALEIIVACSLSPRVQQLLLKIMIRVAGSPNPSEIPGLAIIVSCADFRIDDAECKKSALNVLINLVHADHIVRVPAPVLNVSLDSHDPNRSITNSGKKRNATKNSDLAIILRKAIWDNNGTYILPKLLTISSPLTEADKIRTLTCRVLCGLAKEESIRQIMSKLPLFTEGQIQSFMKEPILPEKRLEHASFCKYARELVELVTGTSISSESGVEPSLAEIKRRLVVNKTKIVYDETEADLIIYKHLLSKGCHKAAAEFYREANLGAKLPQTSATRTQSPPPQEHGQSLATLSTSQTTPAGKRVLVDPNSPGPVNFKQGLRGSTSNQPGGNRKSFILQKSIMQPSHLYKRINETTSAPPITLDSIFTDYLRNQHSQCKNPVAICPPFKLLEPHSCPEPTNRLSAPINIVSRLLKRSIHPPRGGINGAKYDRHYVYSNYRPLRLVKDPMDVRVSSTCCAFSSDGQFLFVGTDIGMLKVFNVPLSYVEASYECHLTEISYVESSKDDNLILTTSPDSPAPCCILWTFNDIFERKFRFDDDGHAEFGKASSNRIVSTQDAFARLWDTETSAQLRKFDGFHRYIFNRATLNYNDTLCLNDGVLWDVRVPAALKRFGKFNHHINGIFHPNGNEVICNAHIWDMRNFRSLRTVQAFDQCHLKFNSGGDVIFSTLWHDQAETEAGANHEFRSSFRTFDSHDYSTIATIDLKRYISDLAVSPTDQYMAVIESSEKTRLYQEDFPIDSHVCRFYEIGSSRHDNIGDAEEENEEEDHDDDDDDDEDDDDDDDDEEDDDEDDDELVDFDEEDFSGFETDESLL